MTKIKLHVETSRTVYDASASADTGDLQLSL